MTDLQVFSASALSVVLFAAAWGKLRAPEAFRRALASYGILPTPAIPVLVVAVPAAEALFGALQWVDSLQPVIGIGMATMLAGFTVLLLRSLVRGVDADCGCFGSARPEKVSWFSIGRNVVLIAIALLGAATAGGAAGTATGAAGLTGLGAGLIILVGDHALSLVSVSASKPGAGTGGGERDRSRGAGA